MPDWQTTTALAALPEAVMVGMWRIPLTTDAACLQHWRAVLTESERARADRFVRAEDRARSILGRAAVRVLLANCLGIEPAVVPLIVAPNGKPLVAPAHHAAENMRWKFNVSHSGDWLLLGLARGREIGVDVEAYRDVEYESLVDACFSAAEAEAWRRTAAEKRQAAFFNGWTRKEACVKAWGRGLGADLKRFSVALTEDEPGPLSLEGSDTRGWSAWPARVDAVHAGAVVVAGEPEMPVFWHFDPR